MTEFRLALAGDAMVTRRLPRDEDARTARLYELLASVDAAFTNIEVVPNDFRGDPSSQNGGSHIAGPAWVLDELVGAGFNLFAAGNNHSLDYGIAGLWATLEQLEARAMLYAGVGRNLDEARMPVYLDRKGASVALIACCSTYAPGQEAGRQRPDMQGRPGINPLPFETTYDVTAAQLDALRGVAEQLGLERQRLDAIRLGFGQPAEPTIQQFLGARFRAASHTAIRTVARARDVDDLAKWVREARRRADIVVFGIHTHEQGAGQEDPAEFNVAVARRMIEEGADIVVGTGPHLLRGLEIHRGRPIFYSLGNFVAQNDLTMKLPYDSYERFQIGQAQTPADLYDQRSAGGERGFPADRRYWESVLPICSFDDGRLTGIDIHPIDLRFGEAVHRRGRPRLAEGPTARATLSRFAELCAPFGTTLTIDKDLARVASIG